jgi:hypothetical protein
MKIVIAALLVMSSLSLANVALADSAKLRMNITGDAKQSYLCINNLGCYKMGPDSHGKDFPVDLVSVQYLAMANMSNSRLYKQTVPTSCNVSVNANQTLVVSGHVTKAANDTMVINGLHCSVV